jgi:hypothetical protein
MASDLAIDLVDGSVIDPVDFQAEKAMIPLIPWQAMLAGMTLDVVDLAVLAAEAQAVVAQEALAVAAQEDTVATVQEATVVAAVTEALVVAAQEATAEDALHSK